jgi:hypothetical protein
MDSLKLNYPDGNTLVLMPTKSEDEGESDYWSYQSLQTILKWFWAIDSPKTPTQISWKDILVPNQKMQWLQVVKQMQEEVSFMEYFALQNNINYNQY